MSVKEIALMQHRRGLSTELPDALEEGEIGFATDTGDIFMGAPNNPLVDGRDRATEDTYPYENIQILTELSDNLEIIRHAYEGNTSTQPIFPTIITGSGIPDTLAASETIDLNTNIIDLTTGPNPGTGLDNAVSAINAAGVSGVFALNVNGFLRLVGVNGQDISVINVIGTPLQKLKIAPIGETGVTYPSNSLITRSMQSVTDDRVSVKAYGVLGDGNQDDAELINAALIGIYTIDTANENKKTLFFPAGDYILDDNSVYLPPNAKLVGEGIDRTVIQKSATLTSEAFKTMDGNGFYDVLLAYGTNSAAQPSDIVVEDMTIENLEDTDLINLTSAQNVTFRRCKFKTGGTAGIIFQAPLAGGYLTQSNITFEDCIFDTASKGIYINNLIDNIRVINCRFVGINDECVDFAGTTGDAPVRSIVQSSFFDSVSTNSGTVISISEDASDIQLIDNRFNITTSEEEVSNASYTSFSNHRQVTAAIADTASLLFESFPLGTTTDTILSIDYVIDSPANPRAGTFTVFYDASAAGSAVLTSNDSNTDATAVFSAAMSNPVGSAEVTLENASTGADLTLKYSYRYSS